MKYQVLKRCVIASKICNVGDIVEVATDEVRGLMGIGRIAPYNEPVKTEDRSVGLQEDYKPRTRAKKKSS
jgi:hypothetical protein